MLSIGAGAALILAAGAADPPRARLLRWQATSPANWVRSAAAPDTEFLSAPVTLPMQPLTLELNAQALPVSNGAWGLWLRAPGEVWHFLVSAEGYLSVSADSHHHWFPFIHIHPNSTNRLSLHLDADGSATLRINDEVAWTGTLPAPQAWGVACWRNPTIMWTGIYLYAG